MLNFSQIQLLKENGPHIPISQYIQKTDFLYVLIHHLHEYTERQQLSFQILEPILELDDSIQSTSFSLNEQEVGHLIWIHDTFQPTNTCYFYNREYKHKWYLLEDEQYETINIKRYCFWIYSLVNTWKSFISNR